MKYDKFIEKFLDEKMKNNDKCIRYKIIIVSVFIPMLVILIMIVFKINNSRIPDNIKEIILKCVMENRVKSNEYKIFDAIIDFLIFIIGIGILFTVIFKLFLSKEIKKYNNKVKKIYTKKNTLYYILEKNMTDFNFEIKQVDKSELKNFLNTYINSYIYIGKIFWTAFEAIFGYSVFAFNKLYFLIYLFLYLLLKKICEDKKEKEEKKYREYIEYKEYVDKYFESQKILREILKLKNNKLVIDISKTKYNKLKENLEKIGYIYKKDKVIVIIKLDYFIIFLKREFNMKFNIKSIENKFENIDYMYDTQEKDILINIKIL